MLLKLETSFVVPSHIKNKIEHSYYLQVIMIGYLFDGMYIFAKSPKIYISVFFVLIFEKRSVIVSVKLPRLGGR